MSRPGRVAVIRDVGSYVGGWALIFQQAVFVPPLQVNEFFLLLAGSLIGVPGIAELIALRGRGAVGMGGAPSGSPVVDSSPPPPSGLNGSGEQ